MYINKLRSSNSIIGIRILISSILILYLLASCGGDPKDYINTPFNRDSIPMMETDSVTTTISDSGIIRYKVKTPKWLIFDDTNNPHWFFPEGIYLEKFDTIFKKQVSIKADTAWNYTQRREWLLKGNVVIVNVNDETIKTQELTWDESIGLVHSNKYVEINRPGKMTLQGIGFEAKQNMTEYRIFRAFDSPFYFEEENTK